MIRRCVAMIGSEVCHWDTREGSAASDEEIIAAAEPSMAMCADGGLLLLGLLSASSAGLYVPQVQRAVW